jgi:peptide/nickel transport system ATP-binding protein
MAVAIGSGDALLRVRDLGVAFAGRGAPVTAVNHASFELHAGEVLGIVGESGSGKSVTLRAIMGLLPATASITGSVRFDGQEILGMDPESLRQMRGRSLSMIFQNPSSHLDPLMTIGRQVAEPLLQHEKMRPAKARESAIKILGEVRIDRPEQRAANYPHQLSGGMKQRAMIASAIACRPRLLLADEPTTALDVTVQAHILALLADLNRSRGLTMVLVSHDLAVIAQVCDRIVVMKDGEVVEQGLAGELVTAPRHPYTQRLIDSQPGRLAAVAAAPTAATTDSPLLEIRNLGVQFRLPRTGLLRPKELLKAVDDVSIGLQRGETLGIVGESGSGKSTVARAIMGLETPAQGDVLLDGRSIRVGRLAGQPDFRRRIQMAFQNPFDSLNPRFTVRQTIVEPLRKHGLVPADRFDARVAELMALVELDPRLADRKPGQLSGGQCQRVGIARALVMEPEILIADEITSALDVTIQAQIIELLSRLRSQTGLSVIFISHDLALVRSFCHRVAVFEAGRVVETGNVEKVLSEPQHPYTQTLIASVPEL